MNGEVSEKRVAKEGQKDWPADKYEKAALIAREQPFAFSDEVRNYLVHNAAFLGEGSYHLGDCSLWYRTDIPPELEDMGVVNVAVDLTARTRSQLEESMKQIHGAFHVFQECPYHPNPLSVLTMDSP